MRAFHLTLLLVATLAILKISLDAQLFGIFLIPIPDSWKVRTVSTMCFFSCVRYPGYPPNFKESDIKTACLSACDLGNVRQPY